jgi:hydrogenase maturation protease
MIDRPRRVLIAGLGNIFLGDDAFGVEVARRLLEQPPPGNVRIEDFGISGVSLIYALLDGYDLVVLIDAVSRGGQPGTLYVIEPEVSDADIGQTPPSPVMLDPHNLDPAMVLRVVASMGGLVGRLLLIGCEPTPLEDIADLNHCLSAPVLDAVDRAVALARKLVADELRGGDMISQPLALSKGD